MNSKTVAENTKQMSARRSVLRCLLVASAEVTELGSGSSTKLSARTSEIGLGGCYVDTLNPFPDGTPVRVRISRDHGVFETNARVAYTDHRYGMGIAFTETAPEQRSILEGWLIELVTQLKPAS